VAPQYFVPGASCGLSVRFPAHAHQQNPVPDEVEQFEALLAGEPLEEVVEPTLLAVETSISKENGDGAFAWVARTAWGVEWPEVGHVRSRDLPSEPASELAEEFHLRR
jgi:hypothetical protein